VLELARRNRVTLPADSVEGLREWFAYRDFVHFAELFVTVTRCLRTVEDYELIVYEFGREMARQNVRYAEVTLSPSTHAVLGVPHAVWFEGLVRGRLRAEAGFGVTIRWIFDIVRKLRDAASLLHWADYATGAAIDGVRDGVVALGLGGNEAGAPPEPFAPYFDKARAAGLRSAPHAGELAGPESVWGALRALGAERIGHGVRAIEDATLVTQLAEQRIPLEVCPTSNLRLGVVTDLARHPLSRLHDAGVPLTINSDDPPLFNTSLNDEAALLAGPFGLDVDGIDGVLVNGVRHSFLPPREREALEASFRSELAALRAVYLPPL
jgi:adenosine deaminase